MNTGFCNICKQDNQPLSTIWNTCSVGFDEQYNGQGITTKCCVKCKEEINAKVEEFFKGLKF